MDQKFVDSLVIILTLCQSSFNQAKKADIKTQEDYIYIIGENPEH
jgi:hypothetical protein